MNTTSEKLLDAVSLMVKNAVNGLNFDKTIMAVVQSVVNIATGEYKVKYEGAIFSAYSADIEQEYNENDVVLIKVPEGNMSTRKIIEGKAEESKNLYANTPIYNKYIGTGVGLNKLIGAIPGNGKMIAGPRLSSNDNETEDIENSSMNYVSLLSGEQSSGLFQQMSKKYKCFKISAKFKTDLREAHTKGNYGLVFTFTTKSGKNVSYTFDCNDFAGNPYGYTQWSPQSIIFQQKEPGFLTGISSVYFYEENFEDLELPRKDNAYWPNLEVKDIELEFVNEVTADYFIDIIAPNGYEIADNTSIDLQARLIHKLRNIYNNTKCSCQWYKQDMNVRINETDEYEKDVGYGWSAIKGATSDILTIPKIYDYTEQAIFIEQLTDGTAKRLKYQNIDGTKYYAKKDNKYYEINGNALNTTAANNDIVKNLKPVMISGKTELKRPDFLTKYKVVIKYQDQGTFVQESDYVLKNNIELPRLEEKTDPKRGIYLEVVNLPTASNGEYKYQWFQDEGKGLIEKIKNQVETKLYLNDYFLQGTSETFYCRVYSEDADGNIAEEYVILQKTITQSLEGQDVIVSFTGEDTFRYDANGDIDYEQGSVDRIITPTITWTDGLGNAYNTEWKINNQVLNETSKYDPVNSLVEKVYVDASNNLHFNIKTKYSESYTNNTFTLVLTTIDDKEYTFNKTIVFTKDGDQGTNGTSYIAKIYPIDTKGDILHGIQPLTSEGTLKLKAFVYHNGQPRDEFEVNWDIDKGNVDVNDNTYRKQFQLYENDNSIKSFIKYDCSNNGGTLNLQNVWYKASNTNEYIQVVNFKLIDFPDATVETHGIFLWDIGDKCYVNIFPYQNDKEGTTVTNELTQFTRRQVKCLSPNTAADATLYPSEKIYNTLKNELLRKIVKDTIEIKDSPLETPAPRFIKATIQIDGIKLNPIYPIDYLTGSADTSKIETNIPTSIKYNASGTSPIISSNPLSLKYDGTEKIFAPDKNNIQNIVSINDDYIQLVTRENGENNYSVFLQPVGYFESNNTNPMGLIKCTLPNNAYLYRTISMFLDTFGNEAINGWDGTSLEINEDDAYILAPMIGAGQKDSGNRFTGMVMGKYTSGNSTNTGLFGFDKGIQTFGLDSNGKATFGASGKGQIVVNGTSGYIQSGNYVAGSKGLKINLADNPYIHMFKDANNYIKIDSTTPTIKLGSSAGYTKITSSGIEIKKDDNNYIKFDLSGSNTQLRMGSNSNYALLTPSGLTIQNGTIEAGTINGTTIKAATLSPSSSNSISLNGYLSIGLGNNRVGTFGYFTSNLPGAADTAGIGMGTPSSIVKITESNVGMSYSPSTGRGGYITINKRGNLGEIILSADIIKFNGVSKIEGLETNNYATFAPSEGTTITDKYLLGALKLPANQASYNKASIRATLDITYKPGSGNYTYDKTAAKGCYYEVQKSNGTLANESMPYWQVDSTNSTWQPV